MTQGPYIKIHVNSRFKSREFLSQFEFFILSDAKPKQQILLDNLLSRRVGLTGHQLLFIEFKLLTIYSLTIIINIYNTETNAQTDLILYSRM